MTGGANTYSAKLLNPSFSINYWVHREYSCTNILKQQNNNMDIHDEQDRMQKHSEVTEIVIGCAF